MGLSRGLDPPLLLPDLSDLCIGVLCKVVFEKRFLMP